MASSVATATRIDGSFLEGGGQVLRNAITYSSFSADTKTAGSTTLLLQVSLPCLLFATHPDGSDSESDLQLRGGTNATKAPPIDFVNYVLFPFLDRYFGFGPKLVIRKRGYYPKGQGEIRIENIPTLTKPLPSITVTDRGNVTLIRGRAYVAGTIPSRLVRVMADAARKTLREAGYGQRMVDIDEEMEPPHAAAGSGSGIILWAETDRGCILSGSAIGERGVKADETGRAAANELIENLAHGGCVDEYLQDQIIIFMALAEGESQVVCGPLSLHTRTAIWLAELMTDAKFTITEGGVDGAEGD
ncbi:hypothetical protein FRC00_013877 [Tulasnella sp. 408]|nr:hypothetical protein FRC00_013877 [Tulasnella sp. 408]